MLRWFLSIFSLKVPFFTKNTVSLFETFMTISTMNTKSGTNRIKRGITLDLQKQKIWFKKQQKEHLFRFDMISNTHNVGTNFIWKKYIFWLYHLKKNTDCSYACPGKKRGGGELGGLHTDRPFVIQGLSTLWMITPRWLPSRRLS